MQMSMVYKNQYKINMKLTNWIWNWKCFLHKNSRAPPLPTFHLLEGPEITHHFGVNRATRAGQVPLYICAPSSPQIRKEINKIEKVHYKRVTKQVPNMKHLIYEEQLKKLYLPKLEGRRRRDMTKVYKIIHGVENVNQHDFSRSLKQSKRTLKTTVQWKI